MDKWNPGKVIERTARLLQQQAARAIRAAAPRVPHRDGKGTPAAPELGGSLAQAVLAADLVTVKRWGVVLNWSKLGQKLFWFVNGTPRQKPRPIPLIPNVGALTRTLQTDAMRHYGKRARGQA